MFRNILFLGQLGMVVFSWRVYQLIKGEGEGANFKERVHSLSMSLISDLFTLIMFIITNILFFWRAKTLYRELRSNDNSKWKSIIGNQFYEGGIEFCCFSALLCLKWPVVFKTLWYLGTEDEDKSTWYEIFMKEFTPKTQPKELFSTGEQVQDNATPSVGAGRKLSDDQWKKQFRRDLQNIGFEFDDHGEIKTFPPTEVMENYQKSQRFRDLILQASNGEGDDNDVQDPNDVIIRDVKDNKNKLQEEYQRQNQQQQQQQQQSQSSSSSSKKSKKSKKNK